MRQTVQRSLLPFMALASTEAVLLKCTEGWETLFLLNTVMVMAGLTAVVTNWLQVESLLPKKRQPLYNNGPLLSLRRK